MTVRFLRWEELILLTKQRKELLNGAEQVHKFIRDASETNDRMNEKVDYFLANIIVHTVYCLPDKCSYFS